jgi:hypothetical protein
MMVINEDTLMAMGFFFFCGFFFFSGFFFSLGTLRGLHQFIQMDTTLVSNATSPGYRPV